MSDLHDDPNDMTSIDLDRPATRRDILELRSHFDLVAEAFRADFRNLFDWTHATTESLDRRFMSLSGITGRP